MGEVNVLVVQKPGTIELNLEDLKAAVSEKVSFYSGLIVTEDTIPGAKKDLAELRKLKTELEDRRKAAKKTWMQPYEEFEKQVKEVTAIVEEPIAKIDKQLKDFEADRIAKKQAHLRELYDANINGLETYLPFETLKRPQWDNKSTDDKAIIFDIQEQVVKVQSDLSAIKALQSGVEDECLRAYKASGNNLAAAIQKNSDYLNAKKRAEENLRAEQERKAREEAERAEAERIAAERKAQEEADRKAWEEADNSAIEAAPVVETAEISLNDETPFTEEVSHIIRVYGETALEDIRQFCEFNEIRYEVM